MANPPPIQTLTAGSTSGTGKTFGSGDGLVPPAPGNLVVVFSAFSVGNKKLTIPSGYTQIGDSGNNGPSLPRVTVFAKIADGSEASVLIEWSGSGQWVASIQEFDADEVEIRAPDDFGDGGADLSVSSMSSRTTSSLAGYAAALFVSLAHNGETPSATNGFVFERVIKSNGDNDLCLDMFRSDANQDSAGTYETTASWTSSESRAAICVAAQIVTNEDGEQIKDYQKTKTYKVTNLAGDVAYVDGPGNGIPLIGLTRGQAKKYLLSMTGQYLLETEA